MGMQDYSRDELREIAKARGVEFKGNPGKPKLLELIEAADAAAEQHPQPQEQEQEAPGAPLPPPPMPTPARRSPGAALMGEFAVDPNDPTKPANMSTQEPDAATPDATPVAVAHLKTIELPTRPIPKPQPRNQWRTGSIQPGERTSKGYYTQGGWLVESTGEMAPGGGYATRVTCPKCDHSHPGGYATVCPNPRCAEPVS